MNRTILLFLMVQAICITMHAQTVNYGLFSGTQSANSSHFGWSSGQLTSFSSTNDSFFCATVGSEALLSNESGFRNIATSFGGVNDRGNAAIKISGSEFSAGFYLYALIVDGRGVDTKRLILAK